MRGKTIKTHDGYELTVYPQGQPDPTYPADTLGSNPPGYWWGWYFTTPDGHETGAAFLEPFRDTAWRKLAGMLEESRNL